MPDQSGAVDLGAAPAPESEKTVKDETPKQEPTALYAFAIIADPEGNIGVYPYEAEDVVTAIDLNDDLIYGALAAAQKDIAAKTTAQATIQFQMMQARAMQEQMQSQQIAQGLNLRG